MRDPPTGRGCEPTPRESPRGIRSLETGRRGEELAAEHMRRRGFRVLERNARTGAGEIDLIAFDGSVLAFVEVKTTRRRPSPAAELELTPLERLGTRQRMRLRRLAATWLRERAATRPYARSIRFDAIGVVLDPRGALLAIEHLEDAW